MLKISGFYEQRLESLEKFIQNFTEADEVQPISDEEIQTLMQESELLSMNLYEEESYDLYLDKFVDEYWKTCQRRL